MQWLGRGQSYLALATEIAWTATRAAAREHDIEWLTPLVEAQLGERFDQLPPVVRRAASTAETEHLRTMPHDHDGAALRAELAARDAAVEYLSTAYMDVLDWSVGLLRGRRTERSRRLSWRRRGKAADGAPVPCEVPQRILDGLLLQSEEPGWSRRRAA